jgi:two-component sensor histidine kinase
VPRVKVLLVEDDDSDAALVMSAAKREGMDISWLRADDEPSFLQALLEAPDAVVTDFNLPSFSALRALEIVREKGSRMPVLVVTGAIADDLAAECMRRGAADYLLKDRLARLKDALEGAIELFRAERRKHEAETRLLAAAASRTVLNEMLLRSLSADASELSFRAVLSPLFDYGALPGLAAVAIELPCLLPFSLQRPGTVATEGPDSGRIELSYELSDAKGSTGRIAFVFGNGSGPGPEVLEFLDEATKVVAGVTRRVCAELSLRTSLAEQEELLREIHHRVKNNLASVLGLVGLEAARIEPGPGRDALISLDRQVRSMALVQEMAYTRGGFTGIDFGDFLRELKQRIASETLGPLGSLSLEACCDGLRVPLEEAVTLGILFNELLGLAAARANGGLPVSLRVSAARTAIAEWRIEYREDFSSRSRPLPGSRELDFVRLLLGQYRGAIETEGDELIVRLDLHSAEAPGAVA